MKYILVFSLLLSSIFSFAQPSLLEGVKIIHFYGATDPREEPDADFDKWKLKWFDYLFDAFVPIQSVEQDSLTGEVRFSAANFSNSDRMYLLFKKQKQPSQLVEMMIRDPYLIRPVGEENMIWVHGSLTRKSKYGHPNEFRGTMRQIVYDEKIPDKSFSTFLTDPIPYSLEEESTLYAEYVQFMAGVQAEDSMFVELLEKPSQTKAISLIMGLYSFWYARLDAYPNLTKKIEQDVNALALRMCQAGQARHLVDFTGVIVCDMRAYPVVEKVPNELNLQVIMVQNVLQRQIMNCSFHPDVIEQFNQAVREYLVAKHGAEAYEKVKTVLNF